MAQAESLPALEGDWMVQLIQSGGFVGVQLSIEITSDGRLIAQDIRSEKTVARELPADSLAALQELVSQSNFNQTALSETTVCADCFLYDLKIQTDAGGFSVQLDDVSLPVSGLEPLVFFLRNTMKDALK